MSPPSGSRFPHFVDGMVLVLDEPVPDLGVGRADAHAWRWHVEPGAGVEGDAALVPTGDVRFGREVWCVYARRGAERVVRLLDVLDLVAERPARRATLAVRADGLGWTAGLRRAAPYLAALDRRPVLHAAAVLVEGGVVLLCGEATAGKSTLALLLDGAGHPCLADDHIVLEAAGAGRLAAWPSFPYADVGAATRRAVVGDDGEGAGPGKRSVLFRTPRPVGPVPVTRLAFLARGAAWARAPVAPAAVATQLLRDVLFVGDPADVAETQARFQTAHALAAGVPAIRLTVPDGLDRLVRERSRIVDRLRP